MAYGTEHGLVIVDIVQKMCLLNVASPDLYGAQDPYSRAPRSPKRADTLSRDDQARSPSIDQVSICYKVLNPINSVLICTYKTDVLTKNVFSLKKTKKNYPIHFLFFIFFLYFFYKTLKTVPVKNYTKLKKKSKHLPEDASLLVSSN